MARRGAGRPVRRRGRWSAHSAPTESALSSRPGSWGTKPDQADGLAGVQVRGRSRPSMVDAGPPRGRAARPGAASSVDLPDPLRPMTASTSPGPQLEVDAAQRHHRPVGDRHALDTRCRRCARRPTTGRWPTGARRPAGRAAGSRGATGVADRQRQRATIRPGVRARPPAARPGRWPSRVAGSPNVDAGRRHPAGRASGRRTAPPARAGARRSGRSCPGRARGGPARPARPRPRPGRAPTSARRARGPVGRRSGRHRWPPAAAGRPTGCAAAAGAGRAG